MAKRKLPKALKAFQMKVMKIRKQEKCSLREAMLKAKQS